MYGILDSQEHKYANQLVAAPFFFKSTVCLNVKFCIFQFDVTSYNEYTNPAHLQCWKYSVTKLNLIVILMLSEPRMT